MTISSLGYAIIEATDPVAWRRFGSEILGLMPVDSPRDGGVRLRLDERPFRFAVVPGKQDRFVAAGWELPGQDAFEACLETLSRAGVAIERASKEDAVDRCVTALARCQDPCGNRLELYYGRLYDYTPFVSPVGISGFVTGNMGFGHVVLPAPDVAACRSFYTTVLGFKDTDEMRVYFKGGPDDPGLGLYFMHCDNPRHHSLALFEAPHPSGLIHLMIEATKLDDVGYALDRCMANKVPITSTLGRHSNDRMVSFYLKTPGGFDVEFGWDGWQVDWETYQPTFSMIPSLWGHRWGGGQ